MAKEKRWVIVGRVGLYVGQTQTRVSAIAEHIYDYRGCGDIPRDVCQFALGGSLDEKQRAAWKLRKRAGDRAVRATISY